MPTKDRTRRRFLASDVQLVIERSSEHPVEYAVVLLRVPLLRLRDRICHDDPLAVPQLILRAHDLRNLLRSLDRPVEQMGGFGEPEAREDFRAKTNHRNAERLEALERRRDVEH